MQRQAIVSKFQAVAGTFCMQSHDIRDCMEGLLHLFGGWCKPAIPPGKLILYTVPELLARRAEYSVIGAENQALQKQ